MAYSGKFQPKNPGKYIGDPSNIVWRSLWERRLMVRFDEDEQIVKWGSEELKIPYISPMDKKKHIYFPDFIIKAKQPDGTHIIRIIEVKPAAQCEAPVVKKKVTKRIIREIAEYGINQAKWEAAREYAQDRGWQFVVLTEHEIFSKGT